ERTDQALAPGTVTFDERLTQEGDDLVVVRRGAAKPGILAALEVLPDVAPGGGARHDVELALFEREIPRACEALELHSDRAGRTREERRQHPIVIALAPHPLRNRQCGRQLAALRSLYGRLQHDETHQERRLTGEQDEVLVRGGVGGRRARFERRRQEEANLVVAVQTRPAAQGVDALIEVARVAALPRV